MRSSLARTKPVRRIAAGALAVAAASATALGVSAAASASASAASSNPGRLFITSAVEHPDGTVTLPLHQGISHGQPVYYVVTEASDGSVAALMGINTSQKLANAANTAGVEKVTINRDGTIVFPRRSTSARRRASC